MRLITRKTNAQEALKHWKIQYSHRADKEHKEITEKLKGVTDPDEIDRIIGNTSWTNKGRYCYECNTADVDTVEIGELPDYESCTTRICLSCLEKAVKLMKGNV